MWGKQLQKMKTESIVTWESGYGAEDTLGCVLSGNTSGLRHAWVWRRGSRTLETGWENKQARL